MLLYVCRTETFIEKILLIKVLASCQWAGHLLILDPVWILHIHVGSSGKLYWWNESLQSYSYDEILAIILNDNLTTVLHKKWCFQL